MEAFKTSALADALKAIGLDPQDVSRKSKLFALAAKILKGARDEGPRTESEVVNRDEERGGGEAGPLMAFVVPGRIE
eukprot:1383095-Amorphochlora_amoeboformis.AAC.1